MKKVLRFKKVFPIFLAFFFFLILLSNYSFFEKGDVLAIDIIPNFGEDSDGAGGGGGFSDGGGGDGGGGDGGGGARGGAIGDQPPEFSAIIPVIYDAIKFFFGFIAIVAAAMVVYGAYMWMFSGGDPQKVKAAQGTLTWAVIGLIFFMLIVVFFDFILRILGIDLPLPDTPF